MVQAYGLATPLPCRRPDGLGLARLSESESSLLCTNPARFLANFKPANAIGHSPNQLPQDKCLTTGKMP